MDWLVIISVVMLILALFLIIGTPISFSLGAASIIGMAIFLKRDTLGAVSDMTWSTVNSFVLTAIPMFILMSEVIVISGIGRDLFITAEKWLSRLPGGLGVSAVASSAVFGAVSGTAVGVVAVVGPMSINEMRERKYTPDLSIGTITGASGLGVIIPPSLVLILYGVITETSIGKLFIAGVLPGIALTVMFSIYVVIKAMINNRKIEHAVPRQTYTLGDKLLSTLRVTPIIILIIAVIGSIYTGVATPTESAGFGVVISMLIALLYGKLSFKNLWTALYNTAKTTSMIMLILINAMLFSYLLSATRIPQDLSQWIGTLDLNRWIIMTLLMLFLILMGMFLDGTSVVVLTVPIIYPVITMLEFDPYWFAIMVMITIAIATITPPVGLSSYVAKSIVPDVPLGTVFMAGVPYITMYVLMLIILSIFPGIALFLIQ